MDRDTKAPPDPRPNPISYASNRVYQADGPVNPISLLLCLAGGMVAAVVGAAVALFWIIERLPFLFLPFVIQGATVGLALSLLSRRLKLRSKRAIVILAISCGTASIFAFQFGIYLNAIHGFKTVMINAATAVPAGTSAQRVAASLQRIRSNPAMFYDQLVIFPRSHHHGFAGFLILQAPHIAAGTVIQLVIVIWLSRKLGKQPIDRPFCEICKTWCGPPRNALVLPAAYAEPVLRAVRQEDVAQLVDLNNLRDAPLGNSCVISRLYDCPKCGSRYADVVVKTFGRYASTRTILTPHLASIELSSALKGSLAVPTAQLDSDAGPTSSAIDA